MPNKVKKCMYGVGRKFVKYTACLYSAALGPIAILHSFLYFIIIFGPRNLWELRAIHNPGHILENQKSLIFRIIPNGDTILALNSPDSYNSNSGIYMPIHALYEEIWKLPCFCLHIGIYLLLYIVRKLLTR